jgi:hypothetical protein
MKWSLIGLLLGHIVAVGLSTEAQKDEARQAQSVVNKSTEKVCRRLDDRLTQFIDLFALIF